MRTRSLVVLLAFLGVGCTGEPEHSRVVPSQDAARPGEARDRPAPGEIRKVETH